ncbi:putative heavy metal-associated domain, HMA, heavy metal-associated domain superfamily [Helianthus annuus]|nr:putative heavy metal-associated domain, HMA, heavy metal-associated domain superfamily [Helianthus annuus]KAJ0865884.1 putative heavy metal-associated domain, HMA, heavy metal-associated domain superfamily [Helianthus annuus]
MTKDEDFKLLKIQTCILRVNLHCDGCKHKVKKLLQRIDGVYQVNIDTEQQKVTVSGSVDHETLIKKLVRAGKHAELWSNKSTETHNQSQSQNHQNQKGSCMKDDKKNKAQKQDFLKALESLKNQQKFQPLISEEDDDYLDDDEDEDDIEKHEEEMKLQPPKANQLALLRQQQQQHAAVAVAAANSNSNSNSNGKPVNGGNVGKVGLNQNGGVKMNNNINNNNNNNKNVGEGKRVNDMSSIMNNLDGFGGGSIGNLGGFQIPQKNMVLGSGGAGFHLPNGGLPITMGGYNPSSQAAAIMNMNGGGLHPQPQQQYNNSAVPASMMMMNMNRQAFQPMQHQQPQMMYNRSPIVPPATGYLYNYNPAPYSYNEYHHGYYMGANGGGGGGGRNSAADMFSDENTSSCSVM